MMGGGVLALGRNLANNQIKKFLASGACCIISGASGFRNESHSKYRPDPMSANQP